MRLSLLLCSCVLQTACVSNASSSDGSGRVADRFMQADIDGDGFISRGEAPSRLDFDAADIDGDGRLSIGEVEAYTRVLRG